MKNLLFVWLFFFSFHLVTTFAISSKVKNMQEERIERIETALKSF
tara:strand:- start:75 stop:209 length:135 start_codon:yes stop_codon:yes gene_type:complete